MFPKHSAFNHDYSQTADNQPTHQLEEKREGRVGLINIPSKTLEDWYERIDQMTVSLDIDDAFLENELYQLRNEIYAYLR